MGQASNWPRDNKRRWALRDGVGRRVHRVRSRAASRKVRQVTACKGSARRGYYLRLTPGSEFDLFLNLGH